jgi:hypothetical protein
MCFGLNGHLQVKDGQLAHLDRDPANPSPENLAFLCQDCHALYDKKSNRVLGFTAEEVRYYRDRLHAVLGHDRFEWSLTIRASRSDFEAAKQVVDKAHSLLLTFNSSVTRREGPVES